MKQKPNFLIFGNVEASDTLEKINELSITGSAENFKALGFFFLKCAAEIEAFEQWDHAHFLYSDLTKRTDVDVDIICMLDKNNETRKLKRR